MPKERIANIVEVVYLVSIVAFLQLLIQTCLYYVCREDSSFEVYSISDINLAKVDKVMGTLEILYGFLHEFDVQIVPCKEILISPFCTPVSCIEIRSDLLAPDYPDVLWQNCIHHIAVVHLSLKVFIITPFLDVCS